MLDRCLQAFDRPYISNSMIYFTKTTIDNFSPDNTENAIRRFSAKRHTSLDLKSSSSYIMEDKYFLGLEGNNDLKITRIRTPFERFFPKVIVSFPKDSRFEIYKIRYSILSTFVFIVLVIAVLQSFYTLIVDKEFENDFIPLTIVFVIFIGLTIAEIKLTKLKIKKAIENYGTTDIEEKTKTYSTP
jgi:hypothetical protein